MPKQFLTTGEAARVLGLSATAVQDLFDRGELKGFRIPGSAHRRIARESLVEALARFGLPATRISEVKVR